jgi:two-component system, NtrC family, sensor kinase
MKNMNFRLRIIGAIILVVSLVSLISFIAFYLFIDYRLLNAETKEIVITIRKVTFFYALFILLTISLLVTFLHYKSIRKSLNQFRTGIKQVNEGNLETRIEIPEVRELGSLGKELNKILDTYEKAQKELQLYQQKELQNTQKLATIGEMSARVAHEIRNPMTGIARALEIIVSDMKDSDHKPILEEIQRQANRVNQAISNMLQYSRTKELFPQQGNINELIRSLVFFLKNQAHEKIINFETDLGQDVPEFAFDHELIEDVLLNLSFNAIQSIPDNGVILFSTKREPRKRMIRISVRDNGSGIPLQTGAEIFKPFFTTSTKGTGLGLAISKDIIDRHNGELWFANNPDSGCTFFISLPA